MRNLVFVFWSLIFIFTLLPSGHSQTDSLPVWRQSIVHIFASPSDSSANSILNSRFSIFVTDTADLLIEEARLHLGAPYRYGGKGPKTFDCAGFARYVYAKFGYSLPGGSIPQYRLGRPVKDRRKLQRGDLVFFEGRGANGRVGHTGIVTEVDTATGVFRFIHAATTTGVIHSYSTEDYYARRYVGARRLLPDRFKPEDPLPPKAPKPKRKGKKR